MGVQSLATGLTKHNQGSSVPLFLMITDNSGAGVDDESPTVSIRMFLPGTDVDSYYFNGTIFAAGVTALSMSEVDPINAPGLYVYQFADPGLPVLDDPVVKVTYCIKYHNAGTPSGDAYEIREFSRALRDFNTQGA